MYVVIYTGYGGQLYSIDLFENLESAEQKFRWHVEEKEMDETSNHWVKLHQISFEDVCWNVAGLGTQDTFTRTWDDRVGYSKTIMIPADKLKTLQQYGDFRHDLESD